ncbi:MAG TPA: DUF1080 domain-containing protein [Verrucomicrobiae bacterium]|nr:DUF1080 domain-containing protein [Verrucomicrobiae bacterium]
MKTSLQILLIGSLLTLGSTASVPAGPAATTDTEPRSVHPGPPPADAIVLFDGTNLDQWKSAKNGGPAKWKIENGYAEVNGTGNIATKKEFGDCQIHLEWATPTTIKGEGQGRGNSGVYLQGRYEIQILDSYTNKTYFNGQAGAVYKQHPPLVNASRPPGEWQTYDIIFHAPRFSADGKVEKRATVTVLHNGVLVQDNAEIEGMTSPAGPPKYEPHPLKQSLVLQDHHNPDRFRNIWIREL